MAVMASSSCAMLRTTNDFVFRGNQHRWIMCRFNKSEKKTEFIFYYRFGCTSTLLITTCDNNYDHDDTPQHVHHFKCNFIFAEEQHAMRMCFKYTFVVCTISFSLDFSIFKGKPSLLISLEHCSAKNDDEKENEKKKKFHKTLPPVIVI